MNRMDKRFTLKNNFWKYILGSAFLALAACSVNPATGEKQFTGLLPAGQEASIGKGEHEKVVATYGQPLSGPVADYVSRIGQKIAANTERTDVQYKFYVIDSPIVNAFAVPGGYIYVSRGLMALANSEAELAGVLSHEIAHITARHAAERMSHGMIAGLGAAVLGAVTGSNAIGQAANVGSDLYIKSYSRGQEEQSDSLGVKYMSRAGYNPNAMASFLASLDAQTKLDQRIAGKSEGAGSNYFSTHPVTADRVRAAAAQAVNYQGGPNVENRDVYLSMINGLTYGDSEAQGFVRGDSFYHTKMGFTFTVPRGFQVQNNPNEVIAANSNGSVIILDAARDDQGRDAMSYLTQNWMKNNPPQNPETMSVNGFNAATAAFAGAVGGKPVTIRVVAIEWKPSQFFRFQMAIPQNAGTDVVEAMKRTTYSFRAMTDSERESVKPLKVRTFTAGAGNTVASAASKMGFSEYREERFRVLNAISGNALTPGQVYKVVTQ
jgi:predicted Zn-dependent protease